MPTVRSPAWNQVNSCCPTCRSVSSRPSRPTNIARLSANEPIGSAVPSRWPHRSAARPPSSSTTAPSSGRAITSHSSANTPSAGPGSTTGMWWPPSAVWMSVWITWCSSVLQQARVVDRGRATGPEDGHDDGQPDDDLGRGHHHHEEGGDLAVEVAVLPGERDEGQVAGVEHQLHAHEDHDGVAPDEDPHTPDGEQDRGEDDVLGHGCSPSLGA